MVHPLYKDVVHRRKPRGVPLIEKKYPGGRKAEMFGLTTWDEKTPRGRIECVPIIDNFTLCIFFHEVAHIVLNHHKADLGSWEEEYEAERWAIAAMRAEGFTVTEKSLARAKTYVRHCIRLAQSCGETVDHPGAMRFAFGQDWRKFL